jgi:hypothetical protein
VLHSFSFPNYLAELGPKAQSEIYAKSSVDLALRDAFRKMHHFLMTTQGLTEDEAARPSWQSCHPHAPSALRRPRLPRPSRVQPASRALHRRAGCAPG